MKTIIVGGVAAGASAAARLRRLDETAEIVMLERGEYISYANCGLPYHLGGVIPKRESLLVSTAANFSARFAVDVRTNSEATAIDRPAKTLTIRKPDGTEYTESYDKLLLATGSSPLVPDVPGADDPRVLRLWTIPDMDRIFARIGQGARRALVVGAGFIGLEAAENLRARGLDVTVVELAGQVLPTIDVEMSVPLAAELRKLGIQLELGRRAAAFRSGDAGLTAVLDDGREFDCDFAVMSIGVKPNSELARAAGLELGARGHIIVDDHLRTSDPDIYAAGDAVEVADPITGGRTAIPLAGPANRQGRIAADHLAGKDSSYYGSFGASVVKVGELAAAAVGLSERRLKQAGIGFEKIYLYANSNASYYPGGAPLYVKLLFAPDGRILGAQTVGAKGADKRIDVIAAAMRGKLDVSDLAMLELSYAPPFNSAKDPVNLAGMIAENVLSGQTEIVHADALPEGAVMLDVRETAEFETGSIPGAVNIPLGSLRGRLGELDKARPYIAFCQFGMRGYIAERLLRQHGFEVRNLSGGYVFWKLFHTDAAASVVTAAPIPCGCAAAVPAAPPAGTTVELDVRCLSCPGPVVALKNKLDPLGSGAMIKLLAQKSFAPDLHSWVKSSGHELLSITERGGELEALIRKRSAAPGVAAAPAVSGGHSAAIVLFSNDLDKAMAALIIACGMAASGARVGIFFTFWGLSVLRKNPQPPVKKPLISKMFGWMLPLGAARLKLSKMNMGGMGTQMMKQVMARENVATLPELIAQARSLGVRFVACEMAMDVMGLSREELIEVDEVAGVAGFVELAKESNNTLFI
jgi:NADPH-dependent 2,4-dienoyl-CoA reductase/sulfur reductase-like enzyme/peroxiredoxin family protein/rhodanese-related sulfurtransferase/TusA-related sulfurtransferase